MRTRPLILLVDDDENFLEIFSVKLRSAGFDVELAHNESEAVDRAGALSPELILMDISMPGATGTDAALAIKQNPKTKNARIVFLTNMNKPWPFVGNDNDEISRELGVEAFLLKTTDLDKLVSDIENVLAK